MNQKMLSALRASVEDPQDCFKHPTRRNRFASGATIRNVFFRETIPNALPMLVREPNHSAFIADRPAVSDFEIGSNRAERERSYLEYHNWITNRWRDEDQDNPPTGLGSHWPKTQSSTGEAPAGAYPYTPGAEARRIAANIAKLPQLLDCVAPSLWRRRSGRWFVEVESGKRASFSGAPSAIRMRGGSRSPVSPGVPPAL
jgi:hypothetical protein